MNIPVCVWDRDWLKLKLSDILSPLKKEKGKILIKHRKYVEPAMSKFYDYYELFSALRLESFILKLHC